MRKCFQHGWPRSLNGTALPSDAEGEQWLCLGIFKSNCNFSHKLVPLRCRPMILTGCFCAIGLSCILVCRATNSSDLCPDSASQAWSTELAQLASRRGHNVEHTFAIGVTNKRAQMMMDTEKRVILP
mmetsp:Transcript_41601/g.110360  ORF Transcript_41601/g.110360 Transcript_41601/m.110360 type:complete len:127 (-) Transcript_41601:25-405(-)